MYPIVGYYRDDDNQIQHISFVVISECLHHDATAVYTYGEKAIEFFKKKLGNIIKVFRFSDGAGSQYKNKNNFMNISYHETDFGVPCEWHFFATSHGKSSSDGLGGNIKRNARLASIRGKKIMTALELYEYIVS